MATLPDQDGMDQTTKRQFAKTLTRAQQRHLVILKMLGDARQAMTCREILDQLKDRGGIDNVTKKTIERDMVELASKYPIECNMVGRSAYWRRKPGTHCGYLLPVLNRDAAAAFLIMEQHLRHIMPPSVIEQLRPWFSESRTLLERDEGEDDKDPWYERVAIVPDGLALIPPSIAPEVLEAVYECLQHKYRLKIDYRNRRGVTNTRVVHPEGLIAARRTLYLAASIEGGYNDITDFALHRMSNPEVLRYDEKAELYEAGSFQEHVEEEFLKFYESEEPINLVLEFSARAAATMREYRISENQTTEELPEGRLHVSAFAYDSHPLRAWLLSYGEHVTVVGPDSLRSSLKSTIESMLQGMPYLNSNERQKAKISAGVEMYRSSTVQLEK